MKDSVSPLVTNEEKEMLLKPIKPKSNKNIFKIAITSLVTVISTITIIYLYT